MQTESVSKLTLKAITGEITIDEAIAQMTENINALLEE
jgi:hypothetical protein